MKAGFTFPPEKDWTPTKALRKMLIWNYADGVYSLRRGACAEGRPVWRAFESTVHVLTLPENYDRGDLAPPGFLCMHDPPSNLNPRHTHLTDPTILQHRPHLAVN